jgi:predicted MFS family arabinose efflux permease
LQAAVGTGAFLGNSVAGLIAKSEGFPAAFAALSAVAAIGFALYRARMPETRAGNESLAPPPG